jgi:hypothetical protein
MVDNEIMKHNNNNNNYNNIYTVCNDTVDINNYYYIK